MSGGSHDFKAWLDENYHVDSLQMKHRKGKRILNEYRLAFLEYKGDYERIQRTLEMDYMFFIADSVDAEHVFDAPIDENVMCDAIEYAKEHELMIELVPNENIRNNIQFGTHYHIEFKKKSAASNLNA